MNARSKGQRTDLKVKQVSDRKAKAAVDLKVKQESEKEAAADLKAKQEAEFLVIM